MYITCVFAGGTNPVHNNMIAARLPANAAALKDQVEAATPVKFKPTTTCGPRAVVAMASIMFACHIGMTAASAYECVATGIFTDSSVSYWLTLYGLFGVLVFCFCLAAGIAHFGCNCAKSCCPTPPTEGGDTAARDMFMFCMFDVLVVIVISVMLAIYYDAYNGDTPFSTSTANSNPRDRISAWRVIHGQCLTFGVMGMAAFMYCIVKNANKSRGPKLA